MPRQRPKNISTRKWRGDQDKALTNFIMREGEGKPRVTDYGIGVQINWKVKFDPTLPWEEKNATGTIPGAWTHLMVTGRTMASAVKKALDKEQALRAGRAVADEEDEDA